MVLVGLICGIMLFVEVGVVLFILLVFFIVKKIYILLLKLVILLCIVLMVVYCVVLLYLVVLFVVNKLGVDIGLVIVYGLLVGLMVLLVGGLLFLKFLGNCLLFKFVLIEFVDFEVCVENILLLLGVMLFIVLLLIGLMLVKIVVELNMVKDGMLYMLLEFIGNLIIVMFIVVFVVYYIFGLC